MERDQQEHQSGDAVGRPRAPHGVGLEEGRQRSEDPQAEPLGDRGGRREHREEPSGACQWALEGHQSEDDAGHHGRGGEAPHGADQREQDQRGDQSAYAAEHRAHGGGPLGSD